MGGMTFQIVAYALLAGAAGVAGGWLMKGMLCARRVLQLADDWQSELDGMTRQCDRQAAEAEALRSQLAQKEAMLRKHNVVGAQAKTELDSAREREKQLSRDMFTLRGERDESREKADTLRNALRSLRERAADLETEFAKARTLYTGELQKSFEKRQELEAGLDNARLEHESFANLLQSSRAEHESANKLLASARARLENLDELEQSVIRLEADNAQLNHDAKRAQQEIDALKRDVAEQDELKLQNQELAQCLESIENSRRQYENDAGRYRARADEAEKKSETLRERLDDAEKNLADAENQHRIALKEAKKAAAPQTNGKTPPQQEIDNLQEIVGIGKVFERALHELGIRSFRQIAAFGAADIARINRELKECRGRLEQDDWIGQARELLYRKYGAVQN